MLASFYQIIWRNITKDRNLNSHRPENLNLEICDIIFMISAFRIKFYFFLSMLGEIFDTLSQKSRNNYFVDDFTYF
jgi:hypothetical protein